MTLEEMITNYIALRDKKKALKEQHKAVIKNYDDAMEVIETYFKKYLETNNLKNVACETGTAFLTTTRSATVADMAAFRDHVMTSGQYELADFRANIEGVEGYFNEHDGNLPPGVNYSTSVEVRVQRK